MGYDIAGVVASAPTGSAFKTGDGVYARLPNRRLGAYAERAAVPVGLLARKPRSLSFEEAASLPTVALTTWQAFTERAHLKSGERVLIQAGAGVSAPSQSNSRSTWAPLSLRPEVPIARISWRSSGRPYDRLHT